MKPINFEIFKEKERVGTLHGEFVKKTDFCEQHILLSNKYDIKPGYVLIADEREKFYVTDVRLHHAYNSNKKLEVFYEIEGEHQRRISSDRKANISLAIAFLSLVVSIIALFKSFIN